MEVRGKDAKGIGKKRKREYGLKYEKNLSSLN
jgi:hypothetical protein